MSPPTSKFVINFTLKQHTPMIHFQSDQSGATLRATELKPKLDKFLIEKLKLLDENNKPRKEFVSWFISDGKQHLALDYKVKLTYIGSNKIDYPKPYVKRGANGYVAPYFADGKSIEHQADIHLAISSFHSELLTSINKNISLFFTFENFGSRQSKGFGSYHLKDTNKAAFQALIRQHPNPVYHFTQSFPGAKEALKGIDVFYRKLKSGLNPKANSGTHFKSLLFQYMCTRDSGWEKRWIKKRFPEVVYGDHKPIDCKPPKEYHYIRALLGLAEHNEYYPYGQQKKLQIKIEGVKRDHTDHRKALYQRFKSPITFKIFESNVYLIHNHSYTSLLGEEFFFSLNGKKEKLSIPDTFNLTEFLNFAQNEISFLEELS